MDKVIDNKSNTVQIQKLRQRMQRSSLLAQISPNGTAHIAISPQNNIISHKDKLKLKNTLKTVVANFKKYLTKAKAPYNYQYVLSNIDKNPTNHPFTKEILIQNLTECLNIALSDFEKNLMRYLPSTQNSDYKLYISSSGKENTSVGIGFKNSQNKETGPFLKTHIMVSPTTGYDMLSINIGYIDKHKKPIITHSFGYDVIENADKYLEQRGDKIFMKNHAQITHDNSVKLIAKAVKEKLSKKFGK